MQLYVLYSGRLLFGQERTKDDSQDELQCVPHKSSFQILTEFNSRVGAAIAASAVVPTTLSERDRALLTSEGTSDKHTARNGATPRRGLASATPRNEYLTVIQ